MNKNFDYLRDLPSDVIFPSENEKQLINILFLDKDTKNDNKNEDEWNDEENENGERKKKKLKKQQKKLLYETIIYTSLFFLLSFDYVNNVIMSIVPISKNNNLIFFILKFIVVFVCLFLVNKLLL